MDFSKIWGSNGNVSEPTDAQYLQGFDFLGSAPPTVELFNYLFQQLDMKAKALKDANDTLFWQASTAYSVGDVRLPSDFAYKYLECTIAGTSGSTEPTWPVVGGTVTDGGVTWIVRDLRVASGSTDNSTRISTTAWIRSNIQSLVSECIAAVATAAGFAYLPGVNGYIKFPSWLGGLIMQWWREPASLTGQWQVTFPLTFPNSVWLVTGHALISDSSSADDINIIGWNVGNSSNSLSRTFMMSVNHTGALQPGTEQFFAIGY